LRSLRSRRYKDRFTLTRVLSREDRDGCLRGRVDRGVLERAFGGWRGEAGARFLFVGTKEMMRGAEASLEKVGFAWPGSALLYKP
jgi:hypothetical protein